MGVWAGLGLKVLEPMAPAPSWPLPLLGPYIQRRVEELTACRGLRVAVEPGEARESRRHRVLARLLGPDPVEVRRPDGKPEFAGSEVSLAHNGSVTFAVASDRPLGCDVEAAEPETWRQLLGEERAALAAHVAETIGETPLLAAGRIWGALEGLKKAGAAPDEPLRLREVTADGWVLFHAGARVVATYVHARQDKRPLRFAVCVPAENGAR